MLLFCSSLHDNIITTRDPNRAYKSRFSHKGYHQQMALKGDPRNATKNSARRHYEPRTEHITRELLFVTEQGALFRSRTFPRDYDIPFIILFLLSPLFENLKWRTKLEGRLHSQEIRTYFKGKTRSTKELT
ncbi:hypothetical protein JTE90_012234 [Oedothorax gibbosus]|uniref:Uncharacterized protein n=1 Tax=Oedothorax gibbosus TaxID=931172 RepID=A0AAV6UY59_9ARAC|nr:hypothetical protein JTE90_012234 [Oedothorax gibbosus]